MKQAIIMTSFGTSVPEARGSIDADENALQETAVGYTAVRAFTSPTIRRILAGRGEQIFSLTEALEQMRREGMDRVVVQPTHLLYGYEYDKLRAEAERFSGCFETTISSVLRKNWLKHIPRRKGRRLCTWGMVRNTLQTRSIPHCRRLSIWRAGTIFTLEPWRAGRDWRIFSAS